MAQEIETYHEHNEPDENDENTWDKPQRKRVKLIVDLCLNVSQETPVALAQSPPTSTQWLKK